MVSGACGVKLVDMSMSSHLPLIVAASEEAAYELPMPAWAFGAIALAVVFLLLLLVWMFRRTAGVPRRGHGVQGAAVHSGHAQGGHAGRGGH